MARNLLDLPHEILHNVLTFMEPHDLRALSLCCSGLNDFISHDGLLLKEIFLSSYDDPRKVSGQRGPESRPDWKTLLHNFVRTEKILQSDNPLKKRQEVDFVTDTMNQMIENAAQGAGTSRNTKAIYDSMSSWHKNIHDSMSGWRTNVNVEMFICGSSLFKWAARRSFISTSCQVRLQAYPPQEHPSEDETDTSVPANAIPSLSSSGLPIAQPLAVSAAPGRPEVNHDAETSRKRLFAKLHCLYGVPCQHAHRGSREGVTPRYSLRTGARDIHPFARAKVYDLRQHSEKTFWGPFLDDGSQDVDWEKVEAIMLMLDYNMSTSTAVRDSPNEEAVAVWDQAFSGTTPYSYKSRKVDIPMNPPTPLELQDPYNITGTWTRVVCFLDYTELFDFNFGGQQVPADQPRLPLDAEEATRMITMKIHVTKIEPPGPSDGQALPVVHFEGTSSSVRPSWDPNANSRIKGIRTVKLTPQGEVRWTTWSIFHGEQRWRSEGIQVGGVQSARGVLGFWFDKDYDVHGPAGPTAFWKSYDGVEAETRLNFANTGLHALHVPLY